METGTNMPVNELTQGPEQESELSASIELCLSLAQEILASIDKLLSVAQSGGCPNLAAGPPDSPRSPRSPRSEITTQPFKAELTEMISKRRNTRSKGEIMVKLGSGPEAEGPLDDGFSWRKYGQKEVLGAKYPRGYYRCTHQYSQGCLATKQVQQSDDNPAIFDVTYMGTHTCDQKPSLPAAAKSCKWTSLVKLGSGPEAERPLDDGYSWRKYGQKQVLGDKYPRGYYGCTHRNPQGCLAMKQVQQSDDNPAIFDVTYRGTHTCDQKPSLPAAAESSKGKIKVKLGSGPEAEGPLDDGFSWRKYRQKDVLGAKYPRGYYWCTHRYSQGCLATKQVQQSDDNPAIFVVTYRGTHTCDQKPPPPAAAASPFLSSSPPSTLDNSGKRSFTEAFSSSVTSELNCFSSSPGRESSYGKTPSLQASKSFATMGSALESVNNFSVFDLDFPRKSSDSDSEILFSTPHDAFI